MPVDLMFGVEKVAGILATGAQRSLLNTSRYECSGTSLYEALTMVQKVDRCFRQLLDCAW